MVEKNKNKKNEEKKRNYKIYILILIILLIFIFLVALKMGKLGPNNSDDNNIEIDNNGTEEIIKIISDGKEVNSDTDLKIFENKFFDNQPIIAPGVNGEYEFSVENTSDENVLYSIDFSEILSNKINMVYKLKLDNVYVRGDQDNYIDIEELDISDFTITKKSTASFTLEWYWLDDDVNDTYTASQEEIQNYKLTIEIDATAM